MSVPSASFSGRSPSSSSQKLRSGYPIGRQQRRITTFTYCQYARDYVQSRGTHAPAASPFSHFKEWPAKGYRREDFPKTEAIVHNFLAIPLGMKYTEADADYIAAAVRQVHGELLS